MGSAEAVRQANESRLIDFDAVRLSGEIAARIAPALAEVMAEELRRKRHFLDEHQLISVDQCAKFLGVSVAVVQESARRYTAGDTTAIPCKKIGREWRFHAPTVLTWFLEQQEDDGGVG